MLDDLRLVDILSMTTRYVLKLLAHCGLLKNTGGTCSKCRGNPELTLVVTKDRSDGFKWRCPKCQNTEQSIRAGSIFEKSKLPIEKYLGLIYMWAWDFDQKHAVRELRINKDTVGTIFKRFRELCLDYHHIMPKIGGPGKMVEFDQTCLVHQKHHRGAPKPGTQVWFCVGVERDSGGRCFAVEVGRRDIKTIDEVLELYVADETTLITDEWGPHLKIPQRLVAHRFTLHLIKHKKTTGGGFARTVVIDGEELRVHTNKCEGLNSHLKHKIKRLRGTSRQNVEGYLAEAVFRMNVTALKSNVFESFIDLLSDNLEFDAERVIDVSQDDDDDWEIEWSEGEEEMEPKDLE